MKPNPENCPFPPSSISSGLRRPCRYESPTSYTEAKGTCPYSEQCNYSSVLRPIQVAYGENITCTLAEPSSSPVVRTEFLYRPELQFRNTLRKHVFEVFDSEPRTFLISKSTLQATREHLVAIFGNDLATFQKEVDSFFRVLSEQLLGNGKKRIGSEWAPKEAINKIEQALSNEVSVENIPRFRFACKFVLGSVLHCRTKKNISRLGRYLGFVDLRLYSSIASPAIALLVVPRYLRHDKEAFLITGNYGETFGAHGFESSIYSMQDPTSSDGKCVQSCTVMSLALLSDRGARVIGTIDVSARGLPVEDKYKPRHSDDAKKNGVTKVRVLAGLSAASLTKLLNKDPWLGVSAELFSAKFEQEDRYLYCRLFVRLVAAYVHARCPVILFVENGYLKEGKPKSNLHAVLVCGLRYGQIINDEYHLGKRRPSELIIHDPSSAPFMVRPVEELLVASIQAKSHLTDYNWGGIDAVLLGDKAITRSAFNCYKYLISTCSDAYECLTSLDCDYDIRLISKDDISNFLSGGTFNKREAGRNPTISPLRKNYSQLEDYLSKQLKTIEDGWYWVFRGFVGDKQMVYGFYANRSANKIQTEFQFVLKESKNGMLSPN